MSETGTFQSLLAITYGMGLFVAMSESSVFTSPDGVAWTERATPLHESMFALAFGSNQFFAVGGSSILPRVDSLRSLDGINWGAGGTRSTRGLRAVAFGEDSFVMAGINGSGHCTQDGSSIVSNPFINHIPDIHALAYADGFFVFAGDEGRIYRQHNFNGSCTLQHDGEVASGTTNAIRALAVGAGLLVATGDNGTITTSPDGVAWSLREDIPPINIHGAAFGNGTFVLVGQQGSILQSGFVSPVEMKSPTLNTDGSFSVTIAAERGRVLKLRGTLELADPAWIDLVTMTNEGSILMLTDPAPPKNQNRFYQVTEP